MNFMEAVKAMKKGKKVTRGLTRDCAKGDYYFIKDNVIRYSFGNKEVTNYQIIDMISDLDWEIFEEKSTWNLADKKCKDSITDYWHYHTEDIKTFIRKVKEDFKESPIRTFDREIAEGILDKRTGGI